jgi:hypothetical protein
MLQRDVSEEAQRRGWMLFGLSLGRCVSKLEMRSVSAQVMADAIVAPRYTGLSLVNFRLKNPTAAPRSMLMTPEVDVTQIHVYRVRLLEE